MEKQKFIRFCLLMLLPLLGLTQIALIVLKLLGLIGSWWVAFCPILIIVVVALAVFIYSLVVLFRSGSPQ